MSHTPSLSTFSDIFQCIQKGDSGEIEFSPESSNSSAYFESENSTSIKRFTYWENGEFFAEWVILEDGEIFSKSGCVNNKSELRDAIGLLLEMKI